MKTSYYLLLNFSIFLLLFSIPSVKADYGSITNSEEISYTREEINLLENGTAYVSFDLMIENTTIENNHFTLQPNNEKQHIKNLNCDLYVRNLVDNSQVSRPPNLTISTSGASSRDYNFIYFNNSEESFVRLICRYAIENYAEELRPAEWLVSDEFYNKHNARTFDLQVRIPKNTIFREINLPVVIENCSENENCEQKFSFRWNKNLDMSPILNLKYEKISLNWIDIFLRNYQEFIMGGFIGALMALAIEKSLEKLYKIRPTSNKHEEENN